MAIIVLLSTTTEKKEDAENIAKELLNKRLIACAQISGPVSSHYRWQGKLEHSEEFVLSVKTASHLFEQVKAAIAALHPYELPEVIGNSALETTEDYLQWVLGEVAQ